MKKAEIIGSRQLAKGKFLNLSLLTYRDEDGHVRQWEAAGRENCSGAVMIIAHIVPDDLLILVRQFRPPAGKYLLEFPAGLLDKPGESLTAAALRELSEETGFTGKVTHVLPSGYSSPGLSGEAITAVFVEIDGDACRGQLPTPSPDPGEHIEILLIPRTELAEFVFSAVARGDGVDTKVLLFGHVLAEFL